MSRFCQANTVLDYNAIGDQVFGLNSKYGYLFALIFCCAGIVHAQTASALPPAAQALLDKARVANPQRYQFALDKGAKILPTSDGRSFYVQWFPAGTVQNQPLIVSMHGSASWAFDEFFLWQEQAAASGLGIVAIQWWFGTGEATEDYYTPTALQRELHAALRQLGTAEGSALLHGFSRGSSNIYAAAALDRQAGDRYYAMYLANSGGMTADYPPNTLVSGGSYGYNVYSGTYWIMFCGGKDPNPDRDGCPGMHRSLDWVETYGGVTSLFIEDQAADHGGFHQSPAHIRDALAAFKANLALRKGAPKVDGVWQVKRDPQFAINGASIPNVGLVNGEVWLVVGNRGPHLYRSADGSNSTTDETIFGLAEAFAGSGFNAGEVVPRQGSDGKPEFYVLGLAGPGVNESAIFRLRAAADGRYTRQPSNAVFKGGPLDGNFLGVPDVTPAADGRLRLMYVSRGGAVSNSRTAISSDGGASFTAEFKNTYGDYAVPRPTAMTTNVDPAVLRLASGGFLSVAMRSARLYLFTSIDGQTFVPTPNAAIEPEQLSPGATGLFDPTLVQLPNGRIFLYATAASDPGGANGKVVRAELIPPGARIGGVVNAASLAGAFAPGSIVSVFGSNLAATTDSASGYPLPLTLGGATVAFGGIVAPLFYASPSQINAQVPFEANVGPVVLRVGESETTVAIAPLAPGLFRLNGDLVTLTPSAPGDVITLYLTGQGTVAPVVATGAAAPSKPPSYAIAFTNVLIGGKDAEVLFSGLAPGFAGLSQVNVRVPAVAAGIHPITVQIGNAVSAEASLHVVEAKTTARD